MSTAKAMLLQSLTDAVLNLENQIKIFSGDICRLRQNQEVDPLRSSLKELSQQFEEGVQRFGEAVEAFAAEEDPFIGSFTDLVKGFSTKLAIIEAMIDEALSRMETLSPGRTTGPATAEGQMMQMLPPLPQLLEDRIRQFDDLVANFGTDLANATGLELAQREELIKSFEDLVDSLERLVRSQQEVVIAQADLAFAGASAAIKITRSFEELLKSFEDLAESRQDLRNKKAVQQEELRKSQEELIKSFEELAESNLALLAAPLQKRKELLDNLSKLVSSLENRVTALSRLVS